MMNLDEGMGRMTRRGSVLMIAAMVVALAAGACAKKVAPVAKPVPPPASGPTVPRPPEPPQPVSEPVPVPVEPIPEDAIGSKSLDDLNRDSPLQPVFFALDRSDLSD